MHCHSFVELHFTANNIKILSVAQQWSINFADYIETYLGWVFMYWGQVLSKFTFSQQIFMEVSNTKFHGNPCYGIHADT